MVLVYLLSAKLRYIYVPKTSKRCPHPQLFNANDSQLSHNYPLPATYCNVEYEGNVITLN